MARFFRIGLVLAVAGMLASSAVANVPDGALSDISDMLTLIPGLEPYPGGNWNEMTIRGNLGGVAGAQVDIIFDDALLVCWCVGGSLGNIVTKTADGSGDVFFELYGGGCVDTNRKGLIPFTAARVFADGILMRRCDLNSPDVVDLAGRIATGDLPLPGDPAWDPNGVCEVLGNDAGWHTPSFVDNLVEPCSKFDRTPANSIVTGADAAVFTPFAINNPSCVQNGTIP